MNRQLAPAGATAGRAEASSAEETSNAPITEEEVVGYREQDRFLPINNIQRLMKRSLPETSKISKDAKECIQECTSEFISFITSEAGDKASAEKRKTITGDDILNALKSLGFDDLSDVLFIYLAKYRMLQRNEPARKRQRKGKKDEPGSTEDAAQENGHEQNGYDGAEAAYALDFEAEEDEDDGDSSQY